MPDGSFWKGYIRFTPNLEWPPAKRFAWLPTQTETGRVWLTWVWKVRVGFTVHYQPSDHGIVVGGPMTPYYRFYKKHDLMRARLANEL